MNPTPRDLPPVVTVDASVIVKWFNRNEELSDQAGTVLQLHLGGALRAEVPAFAPYEVGNATLNMGGAVLANAALEAMSNFKMGVRSTTLEIELAAVGLADRYGLTYYDASYLASAVAGDAPLITADIALLDAARAEGVGIALADVPVDAAS